MPDYLETTVDKFIFKVATDRLYNSDGTWVKEEDGRARIGISDFVQQRSGDIAFADVQPLGTDLISADLIANIETIKVDMELASPISGTIVEINPHMDEAPEVINQDPYGDGWILMVEPNNWEAEQAQLLDPQTYFEQMKVEAEQEAKKL
jgi:glycine cleavage system H protein